MSWMQKLYETYEACVGNPAYTDPPQPTEGPRECALMPECHISQQGHIRITINAEGEFVRAELLPPKSQFVIPATEDSASRSSNVSPHPLCDKIRYCARDYTVGKKKSFYEAYAAQLQDWFASEYSHPMAKAVLVYVTGHDLLKDLSTAGILEQFKDARSKYAVKDEGDLVVVWTVLLPGEKEFDTDKNKGLQQAWINYDTVQMKKNNKGFCMVKGEETSVTNKHPRNIRCPGDGAKLISSNDSSNFTYRGRFIEPEQACTVSYEVSQTAPCAG